MAVAGTKTSVVVYQNREVESADTAIRISPLDGRLPTVGITEMRITGKSAAKLRMEKGIGSVVDWVEVKVENLFSKPGRERG